MKIAGQVIPRVKAYSFFGRSRLFQVAGLNILFDLFKTFNVSLNILKSTRPLYPFNIKQGKLFYY